MKISVLGTLRIDGVEVVDVLTAHKPRNVLAMLMLEPGHAVSTTSLMQELWDERPPRSAATTLQTYVLQLRRMFRDVFRPKELCSENVVVTRVPGYLLQADSEEHDLRTYECLSAQGRRALEQGDYDRARELLSQALELWRGSPLSDVRPGPLLEPQISGLEESRLAVTEMRIEADLRLGRHHELQRELTVLTATHPFHEGLRLKHMLALFRGGQLTAALDSFHQYRYRLITDLGLEPSSRAHRLHQGLLDFEPLGTFPGRLEEIALPGPGGEQVSQNKNAGLLLR